MSGTITHEWVGTTLVVTSDSGTSGCDLKGAKGDMGIRGPQGAAGSTAGANALKDKKAGSAVSITDISPIEHELEVKVSSKNLIPYPYYALNSTYSYTSQGITYEDMGGSIYCHGTATATSYFCLIHTSANMYLDAGETYFLSGAEDSNCYLQINEGKNYPKDKGNGIAYTAKGDSLITAHIVVPEGASVNVWVCPQLEKGIEATEWALGVSDFSATNIKRYNKNLIQYPFEETTVTKSGITFTDNGDGTITANGTATAECRFNLSTNFIPNGNYFLSGGASVTGASLVCIRNDAYRDTYYDYGAGAAVDISDYMELGNVGANVNTYININKGTVLNNVVFKPQLEIGAAATAFESGLKADTYTVNTDGTVDGINSIYPTTTLITDTEGAFIECKYNRDINKAFAELQQAIISLGGNI